MYKFWSIAFCFVLVVCVYACGESSDDADQYKVDFSFKQDAENSNEVIFTNASTGNYLYVEWDFGNGETTGKSTDKNKEYTIYYPLKGDYEVTLRLWGDLNTPSDTKTLTRTISIEADDPDYVDPEGLIWSDEFNSAAINTANWKFDVGTGENGWGNNELQYYTNGENVEVVDGKLVLTAKKVNDDKVQGSYTSTRMISWGKKEFTYGRIEVRAKLPSGTGIWPAIWMLGANIGQVGWPACGEIDIMEYVGYQPNVVHATAHTPDGYAGNGSGSSKSLPTCEEEFHVYGLLWTETSLTFYVDSPDNVVHVYAPAERNASNWPFDKPHFFILNVAVGGNWGGVQGVDNSIFPQTMEVDYVRVYELN